MPDVNTVEALRLWFRGCDGFAHGARFGVDYLGKDPTEYAIFMSPTQQRYKTDILGNVRAASMQEQNFVLASREPIGRDVLQALDNHGFFDAVRTWMLQQNAAHNFPTIAEGTVVSIVPTLTQYLFEAGGDAGRYQISCKMTYRRNNNV